MTVQIDTTAENNGLRLVNQGAHPSAPSVNHTLLYVITGSNSGLYIENDAGQKIGPFITGSSSVSTPLKTIWNVDAPPNSPTSQDDEFDNGSLDVKWSEFDPNTVLTVTESAANKQLILDQSTRAGTNITGIYQTLPAGNFTIWCRVALASLRQGATLTGLSFWENPADTSKSILTHGITMNATNILWEVDQWTNHNTFSAAPVSAAMNFQPYGYFRTRRNGTSYFHAVSLDGLGWYEYPIAVNPLATPTAVGLFMDNENLGVTVNSRFNFFRYVASDVGTTGLLSGQLASIYA